MPLLPQYCAEIILITYSLSRKTVNTRENFWKVHCFATNQKRDESAKDNYQTAACISHDLIRNNKLAFLPRLTFKNQTTEFRIDLEAKFTTVRVFLLSYKKIQIENHQSQPTSMTLWTAREAHRSALLLIGSIFFSQTRCLALSDPIYSIQHHFPINMSIHMSFISILCT